MNTADVIMDMLGNPHFREVLTRYYQESAEPKLVRHAIKAARLQRYKQTQISMESFSSAVGLAIHGARKVSGNSKIDCLALSLCGKLYFYFCGVKLIHCKLLNRYAIVTTN